MNLKKTVLACMLALALAACGAEEPALRGRALPVHNPPIFKDFAAPQEPAGGETTILKGFADPQP